MAEGQDTNWAYQPLTLYLSVTRGDSNLPIPTGTIDVVDDSTGDVVASAALPSGRYDVTASVEGSPAGVYDLTARYSGDDTYGSCSTAFQAYVNPYFLSDHISASPSTSPTADQQISFIATYNDPYPSPPAGIYPDGTVVFTADGNEIGEVNADESGTAVLTRTLPAGNYTIASHYESDDAFASLHDPSMRYSVNPSAASTTTSTSTTTTTTTQPRQDDVIRLAGPTRIRTATAISQATFAFGGAQAVVLATATAYADALAGAPLAAQRNGPLLLTSSAGGLEPEVNAEITRVLPEGRTVFLLGGTNAVSPAIATQLQAEGYQVTRLGGSNRFETATIIAENGLASPTTVFITNGRDFPDALVAGAAAVYRHAAILLTDGAAMPSATDAYLQAHKPTDAFAVGGPAATADPEASPLVGTDRFDTSVRVARSIFPTATAVGIASGVTFPDSLAAAPHIGRTAGPLLLATRDELPSSVNNYLIERRAQIKTGYVYGGTAAISDATKRAIATAIT